LVGDMENLFLTLATLCYGCGTVGYLVYLVRHWEGVHWVSWAVLLTGALVQGGVLLARSFEQGHLAVTSSPEALSFLAWVLVVLYVVLQLKPGLRVLGSFVAPLAVAFMLTSGLLPVHMASRAGIFQSFWVFFHVSALFLANGLFALAFSAGVMYLLQERQIKTKQFGFLYPRLPSLKRLDEINFYCIVVGFPLMTAGLVAGFAYAGVIWHSWWNWDPKEIFAVVTWLIYAVLLHERLAVGWRGRRAAWLAIFGFSAVLITLLGVNLLMKGHHTGFVR